MSDRGPHDKIEPGEPWGLRPPQVPGEPMKGGGRRRPPIWLMLLLVLAMLISLVAVLLGAGQ